MIHSAALLTNHNRLTMANLPFSEVLKSGELTYFPYKIWLSIKNQYPDQNDWLSDYREYLTGYKEKIGREWDVPPKVNGKSLITAKFHTIRREKNPDKPRWEVGTLIHFFVNNRTKLMYQFAPELECKGIQKIRFIWSEPIIIPASDKTLRRLNIIIDDEEHGPFYVKPNNEPYGGSQLLYRLAYNDGFSSVQSFLQWFNDDFDGVIIHWTKFKY